MRAWCSLLVFSLAPVGALAQGQVQVSVDRTTVVAGAVFRITVQATGDRVGEPEIPDVPGLKIDKQPAYTQLMQSIINFRSSITKVRGYNAIAQAPGEIVIPPITVQIGNEAVRSDPIKLTIVQGSSRPSENSGTGGDGRASWDDVLLLTVDLDKTDVFLGERVNLTLTLWALYGSRVRQLDSIFPSTTGFYAAPRDPQQMDEGVASVRNGRQYTAVHWRQTLYATKTGQLEITPWQWQGMLVKPYGREARQVSFQTDPVLVTVKPLPAPPANFAGAVGQYHLDVKRSRDDALQGVPVKLTVSISGHGNPDAIQAPKLPSLDWAYVADPERQPENTNAPAGDTAAESFVYSITPTAPGSHELPPVEFCYFDPELGEYVTAKSDPLAWEVRPSAEPDQHVVMDSGLMGKDTNVQVLAKDILPIVTAPGTLKRQSSMVLVAPVMVLTPALAYGALALLVRRRRRFDSDTRYARAFHATSKARKRLAAARNSGDPTEGVHKALVGYIADAFDVPEAGVTSADAEQLFQAHQVDGEVAGGFVKILKRCERARYGTGALSSDELDALAHGAIMFIDRFDQLRKKGTYT